MKINLVELTGAFEDNSDELNFYLDKQSGEILMVSDETDSLIENAYEEIGDEASEEQIREYFAGKEDVHDWQVEAALIAHRVNSGIGETVLSIPRIETREAYGDMAEFVATVSNRGLRDRLEDAIDGRGAFSRFKNVIGQDSGELERWYAFKQDRMVHRALEWLADEDIQLDE